MKAGVGPSCVGLPAGPWRTITEFLVEHFPAISRETWLARMASGHVVDEFGALVTPERATDWQPYAEQILEVLAAEPLLKNTAPESSDGYAPKPDYRPLTKFENRGIKLGHGVWDVVFSRT